MGIRIMWVLTFLVVYLLVGIIWQFMELTFYGEVQPRVVDDIIALILTASITLNISKYIEFIQT